MPNSADNLGSWFKQHWWQVLVSVFLIAGAMNSLNDKVSRSAYLRDRETRALEIAEIKARVATLEKSTADQFSAINETMQDILSVVCYGKPQVLGCRSKGE